MLYNLAIVVYDLLVHFAAPFSRKPPKNDERALGGV